MNDDQGEWAPELERSAGHSFKWGLNGDSGEFTIWEVSGPGDGFPSHATYLATSWGRSIRHDRDILGYAAVEASTVVVVVYGERAVPDEAVGWARRQFPDKQVKSSH